MPSVRRTKSMLASSERRIQNSAFFCNARLWPIVLLVGIAVLILSCSDAPLITRQGNRVALVELFTQSG
ncbi:MAG: hypothetical protein ABIL25_06210 [candidate division WOR-3 bacterium]